MAPLGERFELRLDGRLIARIDDWRFRQNDRPSRAEAARRLMEQGLDLAGGTSLSDGEKLILILLSDVAKKLGVRGEVDPDFLVSAIIGGHQWALRSQLQGLLHDEIDREETVSEVFSIMNMWRVIEFSLQRLSEAERARVADSDRRTIEFEGFDGNEEAEHFSVATFLVENMRRYIEFDGRSLNSHSPSLTQHRARLAVFSAIQPRLSGRDLTADEIIRILDA